MGSIFSVIGALLCLLTLMDVIHPKDNFYLWLWLLLFLSLGVGGWFGWTLNRKSS